MPSSRDERRRKSNRDAQRAFRERQREAQQQQHEENEALRRKLAATESELAKLRSTIPTMGSPHSSEPLMERPEIEPSSSTVDCGVTPWSFSPLPTGSGLEYDTDAGRSDMDVANQLSSFEPSVSVEVDAAATVLDDDRTCDMTMLENVPAGDLSTLTILSSMPDVNALEQPVLTETMFPPPIPRTTASEQTPLLYAITALQSSESHALKTAQWFEEATRISQQQAQAWFRVSEYCIKPFPNSMTPLPSSHLDATGYALPHW